MYLILKKLDDIILEKKIHGIAIDGRVVFRSRSVAFNKVGMYIARKLIHHCSPYTLLAIPSLILTWSWYNEDSYFRIIVYNSRMKISIDKLFQTPTLFFVCPFPCLPYRTNSSSAYSTRLCVAREWQTVYAWHAKLFGAKCTRSCLRDLQNIGPGATYGSTCRPGTMYWRLRGRVRPYLLWYFDAASPCTRDTTSPSATPAFECSRRLFCPISCLGWKRGIKSRCQSCSSASARDSFFIRKKRAFEGVSLFYSARLFDIHELAATIGIAPSACAASWIVERKVGPFIWENNLMTLADARLSSIVCPVAQCHGHKKFF